MQIAPDGANGAFMVWISGQIGVYTTYEVIAQRVNSSGTALWGRLMDVWDISRFLTIRRV